MVALKINDTKRVFLPALCSLLFNGSRQLFTRSKHRLIERLGKGLDAFVREGLEESFNLRSVLDDASDHCKFILISFVASLGIL